MSITSLFASTMDHFVESETAPTVLAQDPMVSANSESSKPHLV